MVCPPVPAEVIASSSSSGVLQGSQYTPEDLFWGQLAGCLEQIDCGTTTIAESIHAMYSPEHGQ